jgi:hypothetical protein|tara:strand:+ start:33725 stop:35542 length:1818 start_codon:yes stop_codon:yes gene_type:complete
MAYKLNKTDGTLLVDLIDGTIDINSTSLTLVGRNYTGYGEAFNENFIKILENFSNSNSPLNPIAGQTWWDTGEARLKVYQGTQFKAVGGPFVQKTQPTMVAGDLWMDNVNNQLYFYDGTDLSLAGPIYKAGQGETGFRIESVLDTQDRSRTLASLYLGNGTDGTTARVAVISNVEFTPAVGYTITGITGNIKKGINIIDKTNFIYEGTVDAAKALIKADGTKVGADNFVSTTTDNVVTGSLTVSNSAGITIGPNANQVLSILGNSFVTANQQLDENYTIKVTSTAAGSQQVDAVFIDAANKRVGIFDSTPEYTLDVAGDIRVTGNLLVEGATASIDVSTLRVEDKQIELAITSDSTLLTDSGVDDAGIVVRVTGADKKWTWIQATNSWTTTENINVTTGNEYKVAGTSVLTSNTLGSGIVNSSLTNVGTLTALDVDNINLNGSTITGASGLTIAAGGDVNFSNSKIAGIAQPTQDTDAASKVYVDESISGSAISFSMDSTGLNDTQIGLVLNDLVPGASVANGTLARIHCTTLGGASVTGIDVAAIATKSFIAVDAAGVQNESVLQDIGFTAATGSVTVSVTRSLKEYVTSGGSWAFSQNLVSSV